MQRLEGLLRKAVQDYEMIAPGDRVCVGVSGGKDSVALTVALGHLRRYLGVPFEVMAVTLDPRFGGVEADYQPLADLFAQEGIPYEIRRTDIGPVVFDYRKEPNPCALCAKMRRGALHAAAQELGCNKVALGHHLDDAVETFYMNLWREGRIGCFSPVTYLDQRNITLIRPMIFATESEVKSAVYHAGLPIIKSRCPADGATVREQTKLFVQQMSRDDLAFRQKTLHALQQSGIDGWRPLHTGRTRARAIPHNSKCRYGERGAAAAKPKAQIILDAAKVSAASGGNSEPKQGQRSQSARGFCPRSTMRVPQPDIIEHFGNADAVPQPPERCLSR